MKIKNRLSKQILSLVLCLALILIYVPMTAFAADEVEGIPVGDFTIAPTDGATVLTDGTDYTYNSGELVITTTTPITIGMKNGVATTTDTIRIWTTSGVADITLNNVNITTSTKYYTIQLNGTVNGVKVTGDNPCTIHLVGTNTLRSTHDYGHTIRTYGDNSALNITSDSNGVLNASNIGKNGTIFAEHASDLTISGNAVVSATSQAQSALNNCGITTIGGSAKVTLSAARYGIISGNKPNHNSVVIEDSADVNITFGGSSGIYANGGMVTISDNAKVTIGKATERGVYGDVMVKDNAEFTVSEAGKEGIYGNLTIQDNAKATVVAVGSDGVLSENPTVKPVDGKAHLVKVGVSEADAVTSYYTEETSISYNTAWRYFRAESTDKVPVMVTFDSNGDATIDPITVTFGEKYGTLPSSAIAGLSGGDSNWYLVDANGNVTETKITNRTIVETSRAHTLFVKRKVLAPTLKIALTVPGAISNDYQYYVPGNSQRILTVTISNQNTDILDYTYQWYKDGILIENATEATLTLDGSVSDSGTYTVKVTATLKGGTGIVVTENTASAEKEQKVKIIHVANTLYYDANGGEGGPSSNYAGGATITVAKEVPTRTGYVFSGWNTKADGTGESYDGGATYTFAEDNGNGGCNVTLYAQWIKSYGIYVGDVPVTEANKDDVFGDGTVSYDVETNTLTLNGYSYEGEGYLYSSSEEDEKGEKEIYSAAIYSEDSITIKLEGSSTLKNSFDDSDKEQYGDGVVVEGDVTFIGDGNLSVFGAYGIEADGEVTIEGGTLELNVTDVGIISVDVTIKNSAVVAISANNDGIYAIRDVVITDSIVDIDVEGDGIYSYDGGVSINSTKTSPSIYGSWLEGTKVSIKAGGKYGIFAYNGLTVDEKLTISSPEGAQVGEMFVADEEDGDYTYGTVMVGETVAKNIVIEPLGYTVAISGLSYDMTALVPTNQSLNEAYCEIYAVEDFSEILEIEKEGYIFGGWYTDETCTNENAFDFDSPVTADITIYAKWIPVYTSSVVETEGGDATVSPETSTQGETMVITPKPDDGKKVDTVTVTDKDGNSVTVIKNDDGTYSFIQPESEVTVKVTYKDKQTGTTGDDIGKVDNKPTDSPQTGDTLNLWMRFALLFVSGGAVFGLTLIERKRKATK